MTTKTTNTKNTTTFDASKFATTLTTADKNGHRVPAVKFAIACFAVANNMEKGANIALCLDLYGVPSSQRTKANRDTSRLYNQAKGYWKDYVKFVNDNRQHFTKFFEQLTTLDFSGTFAQLGDRILSADIYGLNGAPQNGAEWKTFLSEYLPASAEEVKAGKDAAKGNTVNAKDKADGGSAQREADGNLAQAVHSLMSKVEVKTNAAINAQLEALDSAGLPKTHRAKVSKAMMALTQDILANIEKQMQS